MPEINIRYNPEFGSQSERAKNAIHWFGIECVHGGHVGEAK